MTVAAGAPGAAGPRFVGLLRSVRWYVRELSGESAYDRYLARQRRDHPGQPPLDARTWWRQRLDDREDGPPPARCC